MEYQPILASFEVLLFSLFMFIVVSILLKRAQRSNNSASKLPPGPWRLPFVGNLHQLWGTFPHHTLRDLAKKHGPFMYLKIGQVPTIVVSSSEYAKEVMKTHDIALASRPQTLASKTMAFDHSTDIIFAPYSEYWRELRKICSQELLSPSRVRSFQPIREEESINMVKDIASSKVGSPINLTQMITFLSYSITSRAAFGNKSSDHEEFISIVEEILKLSGGFAFGDVFPSLSFLDWYTLSKYKDCKLRLSRILERIVNLHIDQGKDIKSSTKKSGREEDLVDVLLRFHKCEDHKFTLTNENIKAVICDIFAGGSETSATTINWAMAEMMRNPRVMNKAQEEVRQVFGEKGLVSESLINEMKYLKSVVKETLRLHPPAPLLVPRESREKCEINGYEVPIKTRIIVNAWAIGRDPKYWIESESFMPERFVDSSIDFKGSNFEYTPFGAGRRICPGMSFGLISVELPLAFLLYHFDWKLPNEMKHEELDMAERFGITTCREKDLYLIPSKYDPPSMAKAMNI